MFYAHKVGPSCFFSLHKVAWVLRGLPPILAFRLYIVSAHLFGLGYDRIFAFDYLVWIGMLCWETSQYCSCIVITLGRPCLL